MGSCDTGYATTKCSIEYSKLFLFFRLREVVPREAYLSALRVVSPRSDEAIF